VNCPNCGAAMRMEAARECLVCDFCKTLHFPEPNADGVRVLGEPVETACPVCEEPLVLAAAAGERLLYCGRCRGLLIPMGSFVEIVRTLRARHCQSAGKPAPVNPRDLERRLRCPHCGQPMHTHPYAGPGNIVIDNCPPCAVNWLDHSELRRIVRAPERTCQDDAWQLP